MSTFQQRAEVVVANLRVRGFVPDPLATRLRLAALLSSEDLSPPGLPPSAIVCIRALRDPLPRSVHLHHRNMQLPRAWRQAVIGSLEEVMRHAAQPALQAVPSDSACVIFADQDELLACLALDWLEGRTSQRWWWRGLFKGVSLADSIWPVWRDAPEYIPGALQRLADRGKAAEFARSLSAEQASLLLRSVTRRYALQRLQAAIDSGPTEEDDEAAGTGLAFESDASGPRVTGAGTASHWPARKLAAPWHGLIPESRDGGLQFEQQCFLGIALMLHRAPAAVRRPDFARRACRWRRASVGEWGTTAATLTDRSDAPDRTGNRHASNIPQAVEGSGNVQGKRDTPPPRFGPDEKENGLSLHRRPASHRPAPDGEAPPVMRHSQTDQQATAELQPDFTRSSERESALRPHDLEHEMGHARQGAAVEEDGPGTGPRREATAPSEVPPHTSDETLQALPSAETQIATEYGWLFYLINLGLFLNLYSDFTSPNEPGIPLDIWDFVALLGLRIAGEQVRADPLWLLLARLSGRADVETPGNDFVPPAEWRVPAEWLAPFEPGGVWRWSACGGRLRVLHAEGFPVLDLPSDEAEPRERLKVEMRAYRSCAGLAALDGSSEAVVHDASHVGPESSTPLQRWADCLSAYVRARLRRAFGFDDEESLARVLCRQPARVFVTAARVDVMFALNQLPIEIRRSGLDRDPGWVPAAGRFISFHYD